MTQGRSVSGRLAIKRDIVYVYHENRIDQKAMHGLDKLKDSVQACREAGTSRKLGIIDISLSKDYVYITVPSFYCLKLQVPYNRICGYTVRRKPIAWKARLVALGITTKSIQPCASRLWIHFRDNASVTTTPSSLRKQSN